MIIRAELKCKQTGCEADPCAVDKVIELPSPQFQQFSRALLADYDFIAENKNAIRHDDDSRHCLLILDAEGTDGFLVDPQGYNYARYGHENVRRHSMGETNITINFDAAKLDALEFVLRKQRSSVQRRMVEMLQQLYESEVPEAVREYVDSKATPVARPKRPVRAAKAANEQAAAMQQEE